LLNYSKNIICRLDLNFLKHTSLMFIGVGLYNLFNLLFHLFMVRFLPPIDYGHLNTLLALLMIISVPAGTIQTAVTRFVSSFKVQKQYEKVKPLLNHLLKMMAIVAVSIFILIVLGTPLISNLLHIPSYFLFILLGIALFLSMMLPISWGGLQGLQRFDSLAFNLAINGGLKFLLGILFILLGWGISGAMGSLVISNIITLFFSYFMLRINLLREEAKTPQDQGLQGSSPPFISEVYQYFFPVGISLLCFMVLTNIDLIFVKHLFSPLDSGYYSIAQMVGKIILFLPLPIVTVMFPKLSSSEDREKKALWTLKQSLTLAFLLCIVMLLFCLLFPSLVIQMLSGKNYPECIPLVRLFCINMTFFSLIFILLYYHLSTHRRGFLYPLFFSTLIQVGLLILFHKTLVQVLLLVGIISIFLFGITLFLAYHPQQRRDQN